MLTSLASERTRTQGHVMPRTFATTRYVKQRRPMLQSTALHEPCQPNLERKQANNQHGSQQVNTTARGTVPGSYLVSQARKTMCSYCLLYVLRAGTQRKKQRIRHTKKIDKNREAEKRANGSVCSPCARSTIAFHAA